MSLVIYLNYSYVLCYVSYFNTTSSLVLYVGIKQLYYDHLKRPWVCVVLLVQEYEV